MFSAFPPSDMFFQLLYTTEETKMWDKNLLRKFFFNQSQNILIVLSIPIFSLSVFG